VIPGPRIQGLASLAGAGTRPAFSVRAFMTKVPRIRKPSYAQVLEVAQKAGATSVVYEQNGVKIETRFVRDASESTNPWNAEMEKLSRQ